LIAASSSPGSAYMRFSFASRLRVPSSAEAPRPKCPRTSSATQQVRHWDSRRGRRCLTATRPDPRRLSPLAPAARRSRRRGSARSVRPRCASENGAGCRGRWRQSRGARRGRWRVRGWHRASARPRRRAAPRQAGGVRSARPCRPPRSRASAARPRCSRARACARRSRSRNWPAGSRRRGRPRAGSRRGARRGPGTR